ncbi:MAG: restriction endonuclease subunit S [Thermodesulfobacteriota bacterium]|jgi:type I restriction enzyme S subunit
MKQFGSEGIETPFDMPETPEGWQIALLGQIAQIVGGGTPKTSDSSNFSEGEYPWITPADLSGFNEMYISRGRRSLSEQGLKTSSALLMPKGTVLMSSRAPIGYLAIAANELCTKQGFKSFICSPGVTPEYVFFWLKLITPFLENIGSGSTFLEISGSRARKIPILLAPTSEQKRIITKVEELLARVNTAKERLNKVPKILKRFRQAILAAACSARLTAGWREKTLDVEPATRLLNRIQQGRTKLKKSHMNRANGEENIYFDIPDSWSFCFFEDISSNKPHAIKAGPFGSSLTKSCYTSSGYKIYGQEQVIRGDVNYGDYYIDEKKFLELKSCEVDARDLLISLVGTIGKVLIIPGKFEKGIINPRLVKVSLHSEISPEYITKYLGSPLAINIFKRDSHGGTMEILNLKMLKGLPIPLPPVIEQHEIVRRVESMLKLADAVEKRVAVAKLRAEKLTQALLAKAFRGGLVPTEAELAHREGRSYETASELLARIKSEKEKTSPKKVINPRG